MDDHTDRHRQAVLSVYESGNPKSQAYNNRSNYHLSEPVVIQGEVSASNDISNHSGQAEYGQRHANTYC